MNALAVLLPLALLLSACHQPEESTSSAPADHREHKHEQETLWTCSMHPQVRQPEFGLCPICHMDLIPLESDEESASLRQLSLSPEATALAGIEVTPVVRATPVHTVPLLGRVSANERHLSTISAWMDGRIEHRYADTTGTHVVPGDHLLELYSPELRVLQQDLILGRRSGNQSSVNSLRERLRLLGLSSPQIEELVSAEIATDSVTITAPSGGTILEVMAHSGDYVKAGEPLYRIADLSTVWIELEAYEDELPWLRYGQQVEFTAPALPGQSFEGRVFLIEPTLDEERRVVRLRVEVENPGDALIPGMYVEAQAEVSLDAAGQPIDPELAGKWISPMHPQIIADGPGNCPICGMDLVPAEQIGFSTEDTQPPLLVPASAVLPTGRRALVYVQITGTDRPTFEGREVLLGPRAGDWYLIRHGLAEGQLVVTQAAFVLDSDLQLKGKPALMSPEDTLMGTSPLDAPASLALTWEPVARAGARLRQGIARLEQDPDLASVQAAAATLAQLIDSLPADQLDQDQAPIWRELSMRLGNSAAAIQSAASLDETQREWQSLRHQWAQANRTLGLALPPLSAEPSPTDAILATQLRQQVLPGYETLRHALAEEEAWPAEGRDQLALALSEFKELLAEDPAADSLPSKTPAAEADPETLRHYIDHLTEALLPLIREHALDQVGPLYLVHCPMAFGDQGADWFSPEPLVENPYFGSQMYSCGVVKTTLSVSK